MGQGSGRIEAARRERIRKRPDVDAALDDVVDEDAVRERDAVELLALVPLEPAASEDGRPGAIRRALRDRAFVGGLWLNTLPALFFGVLDVLVPLRLDDAGYGAIAIAAVFVTAGLVEVVVNPIVGRVSDRRGRLLVASRATSTASW